MRSAQSRNLPVEPAENFQCPSIQSDSGPDVAHWISQQFPSVINNHSRSQTTDSGQPGTHCGKRRDCLSRTQTEETQDTREPGGRTSNPGFNFLSTCFLFSHLIEQGGQTHSCSSHLTGKVETLYLSVIFKSNQLLNHVLNVNVDGITNRKAREIYLVKSQEGLTLFFSILNSRTFFFFAGKCSVSLL